ncbi:ABC transporter permease [Mediterraneibacter glycyrrhizinilyticus]|nr:ABC transporter permease [Mediterraneibacter glycyrrhizinilyticus]MBM6853727.1 ABC transporter permease [Mediterraneibacter glycyrrhizinilyticus]
MRNNNREVIRMLARESYRANRSRNRILITAVAFTVMMLFCVFSLAIGKIATDCLLYTRNAGTAAYTMLERANEAQKEEIDALPYIRDTGFDVVFGYTEEYSCEVMDKTTWEIMQKPAYSDIHGTYPEEKDEIMLSMRALNGMGITDPEVGMEIRDRIQLTDGSETEGVFRLSGFYTEYMDPTITVPAGYFSKEFYDTLNVDTDQSTILLIRQDDGITDEDIMQRLYTDVTMRDDSQQFLGGNSFTWQAVYDMTGGFGTAAFLALLILAGAGMLLYNVMHISISRDIRQYGLLKTMGATKAQLERIVFRQTAYTVLWGCLAGAAAGSVITVTVIPGLLSGMYLHGLGDASAMIAFRPWLLLPAVCFGAAVTFVSAVLAVNRAAGMSPVEAVKYTGQTIRHVRRMDEKKSGGKFGKEWIKDDRGGIALMAWRNLFRVRKRFLVTVVSLLLGITVSLGAVALTHGTDETNRINYERPDFSVEVMMNAMSVDAYHSDQSFFPQDVQGQVLNLRGVTGSRISRGGYGRISLDEEAIQVFAETTGSEADTSPFVVQAVSDRWLAELDRFAEEKGLDLDVDSVRKGEGLIFLHYRALSRIEEEKGREDIGKELTLTDLDGNGAQTMRFAGYLDCLKSGLPDLNNTAIGPGIIYFLAGEEGFQKLGLTEQTFEIELEADPEYEPTMKATLSGITADYNRAHGMISESSNEVKLGSLNMYAKSDELAARKDYIYSSRTAMGALCILLILMGLVNYVNVTLTGLAMRRKEFAVLESIGLTRRQLKRMLLLEGVFYSLIVTVLLLTAGTGALYAFGAVMDEKIVYFVFRYPAAETAVCIILLFVICTAVPLILFGRTERESVVERLKTCAE